MTIFEYIMVMVSIILALALAQLLRALTEIATSTSRYWVHALWVGILSFIGVQMWWGFWDFNTLERWTFAAYLGVLVPPTLIFVSTYLLVPATRTPDIDWRAHFFATRRWFFSALTAMVLCATMITYVLLDAPLMHPYRGFQAFLLLAAVSGTVTGSERYHEALAIVFLAVFAIGQVVIRMNLGALSSG